MLFVPHGRCRLCGFLCFPPLRTVHATFIAHGAPSVTYHRLEAIAPVLITSTIITSTSTFLHRFNCLLFFVSLHLLMLDTFPRSNNPIRHIYLQVPAMGPMTFFGSLSYASPYLAASSTCIAAWTVSLYFAGSSGHNGHAHHGYFMDHRHISWLHESTFCRLYRASHDLTFVIYRMSEFMVDIPIYRIVSSPAISCSA